MHNCCITNVYIIGSKPSNISLYVIIGYNDILSNERYPYAGCGLTKNKEKI